MKDKRTEMKGVKNRNERLKQHNTQTTYFITHIIHLPPPYVGNSIGLTYHREKKGTIRVVDVEVNL